MGKIIIVGLFLLLVQKAYPQIRYEDTFDSLLNTFQIDNGEVKYVSYDKTEKKLFIFNLDRTLWREIKLALPKDSKFDEIKNISVHTFNNDSLVELAYTSVRSRNTNDYETPGGTWNLMDFTLNIVNERGETLLKVPDSSNMKIYQSEHGNKLLVTKDEGEGLKGKFKTIIYSF